MSVKRSKVSLTVGKMTKSQREQHKALVKYLTHKPVSDVLIGGRNCVCCRDRRRKWIDPDTGEAK